MNSRFLSTTCTALLALLASAVHATDYKPWYGRVLQLETQADVCFQMFDHVDSHHSSGSRKEFDTFIDLGASMALWEDMAAELEVIALQSRNQSFGMDAIRLTGRYRWLNDIVGDPVSLSTGVTVSTIFPAARRNIATFDHGGIACEAHLAIGREVSCMQFWTSRAWGVFGIGVADVGSPWLRANLAWEHNWWDRHRIELFSDSIWGLGGDQMDLPYFHGYGPIQYQAVDVGARYYYQADYGIVFSLGYGYRIFARNCPQNVNFVLLRLEYPLSL